MYLYWHSYHSICLKFNFLKSDISRIRFSKMCFTFTNVCQQSAYLLQKIFFIPFSFFEIQQYMCVEVVYFINIRTWIICQLNAYRGFCYSLFAYELIRLCTNYLIYIGFICKFNAYHFTKRHGGGKSQTMHTSCHQWWRSSSYVAANRATIRTVCTAHNIRLLHTKYFYYNFARIRGVKTASVEIYLKIRKIGALHRPYEFTDNL